MTIENASGFFAFDVTVFLLIGIIITFFIVVIDKMFFMTDKTKPLAKNVNSNSFYRWIYFFLFLRFNKGEKYINRPKIVQLAAEFFPVLLLVFFLRSFIVEPFRIPSNSMMPTLLTGDFILVNKFSYGLRMPISNDIIIKIGQPKRGDVAVFRYPNYERNDKYKGADFIKRIIGLPGDNIIYKQDKLMVNGKYINYINLGNYKAFASGMPMDNFKLIQEDLTTQHKILVNPNHSSKAVMLVVPKGHYFVMGDNRDNSSDSRFWGFVPQEYLVGKAIAVWMYFDNGFKFSRIGAIK